MHRQEINEYPEDLKADYLRLSEWVRNTRQKYGRRVVIRLVDPQSLGGMWKVLRHRIRQYPTFFVDATERIVGWEGDPDLAISRALSRRTTATFEEVRV